MGVLSSPEVGEQLFSGGEGWGVNCGDTGRGLSRLLRLPPNADWGPPEPGKPVYELMKSGESLLAPVLPGVPATPAAGTNSGAWGVTWNIQKKKFYNDKSLIQILFKHCLFRRVALFYLEKIFLTKQITCYHSETIMLIMANTLKWQH
jgi:hypothetical protein